VFSKSKFAGLASPGFRCQPVLLTLDYEQERPNPCEFSLKREYVKYSEAMRS
jgi:hypothetical protein